MNEQTVIECLTDIFERADNECWIAKQNRNYQGNWRIIKLQAKFALKEMKAPVPETEEARFKREQPIRQAKDLEQQRRREERIEQFIESRRKQNA